MRIQKLRCWLGIALSAAWIVPAALQTASADFTRGYWYDDAGRLTGVISPDPDGAGPLKFPAVRNTLSSAGLLLTSEFGQVSVWQSYGTAPASWSGFIAFRTIEYRYDDAGRLLTQKELAGGVVRTFTQNSYDAYGRLGCTAVRMNPATFANPPASACNLSQEGDFGPDRITRNTYNTKNELTKIQRGYGTGTQQDYASYQYSGNGKRTHITDANGNLSLLTYSGHDELEQINFPSKVTPGQYSSSDYEHYQYDPNGNLQTLRKRDGQMIVYAHDALNRVSSKSGSGMPVIYYGYDLRNLQEYARFNSSTGNGVSSAYDAFGALSSSTVDMGGSSLQLAYRYDANGNRTRITHPDGAYFQYDYDSLDRVTHIRENGGAAIATLSYDLQGRRSGVSYGAAVSSMSFEYDGINRLETLTQNLDGAQTGFDLTHQLTYNPASQVRTSSLSSSAYQHLPSTSISRGYQVNGLNQYTQITSPGSVNVAWDTNGNLYSDGANSYSYDVENRLTSVSGSKALTLTYDPLGRLFETAAATGTARFLYDGSALVGEYTASGELRQRYVHGPGVDEPLVGYNGPALTAQSRRYFHSNPQGSVVAVSSAAGSTMNINTYDPYGVPATTNSGRFQYTGQIMLPEVGLYHYKARIYDPVLGRFLQTDPSRYEDDVNLYAYVGNSPVNMRDPTGMYLCKAEEKRNCEAVANGLKRIAEVEQKMPKGATKRRLQDVLKFYGKEGEDNGVNVSFDKNVGFGTHFMEEDGSHMVKFFDEFYLSGTGYEGAVVADVIAVAVAHEGSHGVDSEKAGRHPRGKAEHLATERTAYTLASRMHQAMGTRAVPNVWDPSWPADKAEALRKEAIEAGAQRSSAGVPW